MWQVLRQELHPQGLEIVTVGMDTAGAEACRPFIEAANPRHPSLVDVGHAMAERFGVTNIPNGIWVDEEGVIVRPAEPAFAPQREAAPAMDLSVLPERIRDIFTEASQMRVERDAYVAALRDWVVNGAQSVYALDPGDVVARSGRRDRPASEAAAHFELAQHLWRSGRGDAAVRHFRDAHRLAPENIAYKRQAWRLATVAAGPFDRFWQGPADGHEGEWPYESDFLTEVRTMGPENYYPELQL